MFIAALVTIAKTWKEPKCPLMDEWIKKMSLSLSLSLSLTHTHTGTLLSHKENKVMPVAATWMQTEVIVLSEVSQKEKDKYHMISRICGI